MSSTGSHADAPLMLSVSGMRGIVDKSLTESRVRDFARAFGSCIIENAGHSNAHVVLGRDSRPSGERYADAAAQGLMSIGCKVTRLGIVATPTAGVMIQYLKADGGMVITASHNPAPWNGVKVLNQHGAAPPKSDADEIIRRFHEPGAPGAGAAREGTQSHNECANEIHVQRVLDAVDVEPIRQRRFKIVLDSVSGAGGPAARMLLDSLGCELVHMHGEPTGAFPHSPEPTEDNLVELARATKAHGADIGFAQDPDADRLAIVDETGRYIGEEYTLALAAWRILQMRGAATIVANLSTSRMIDDIAGRTWPLQSHDEQDMSARVFRKAGPGRIVRTAVGEANVVAAMRDHNALIGGEGNGGVIFPPVCLVRDSLSAMALVLALMAHEDKPLSQLVGALPRYVMIKQKFDLPPGSAAALPRELVERLHSDFSSLPGARFNTEDGLRIDLVDSWVHLRGSNTEPIVRLIAEATTREEAVKLVDHVARVAGLGSR